MTNKCIECGASIADDVYNYSLKQFKAPICRFDQDRVRSSSATKEAVEIYFALRMMGVPAKL